MSRSASNGIIAMKKKVGILTTYFATNFGAMLQSFALKRTLEQMGYEVELIRYRQPKVYETYKPFKWSALKTRNLIYIFKYLFVKLPITLRKAKNFKRYLHKFVQPKEGFVEIIPSNMDYYIFGSDQIWNPKITGGFDDVYFGNFYTKPGAKKIVYAASAESIDYTEEQCRYLIKNLSNFEAIGVRESKLATDLIRNTGLTDIVTVVDPTILVDKNVFKEITHVNPLKGKKYLLFYKIRNCMEFAEKIYSYARIHDCEMLILSSWFENNLMSFAATHPYVTYLPEAGIDYFLGAIQNAEFIFTPSFHGTVFSILYHKPFYSLVLKDSWNTRANDLLCSLNIENRLLRINDKIQDNYIDYYKIDLLLEQRRRGSMDFLVNALNKEIRSNSN